MARSFQTKIGGVSGEGDKLCPSCEARYGRDVAACPRDGTKLVDTDDTVGTILSGTYFVRRVLGEGAMGRVFEARHTRIPVKRFAIKMLHPEYVHEPQILARFAREAEAAATIDHPNVVGVVDVDRTPDGRPFLVTDFLQGKDFGDHLYEVGKMPVPEAVRVARQISGALAAAHARGIVHRDVKPENVFLTGDLAAPVAKVLDFGMSRLDRREGKALTQAGAVVGTPAYMPPEQARGDRVDHRADVYAVGAILYTAVTGRRPFDGETPAQTLLAVLAGEPERPRAIVPAIPAALEQVILRAMAREPDQRYATMDELTQALAPFDVTAVPAGALAPVGGAGPAGGPTPTLRDTPDDRLIELAHPILGGLIAVTFGWLGVALLAAISSVVKATHSGGDTLSTAETLVVIVVVLAAIVPPLVLAVQMMFQGSWKQPVQAASIVRRFGPSVIGALAAYGFGAAGVRGLGATFLGSRTPWAGMDVLLLLLGLVGAALPAWALGKPKRARTVIRRF